MRFVDKSYTNAENTREADSQYYLNMAAKYGINSWVWEFYVNNLLNGKFHLYDGSPASTTTPYQGNFHQVSTPRELGIRANYYW